MIDALSGLGIVTRIGLGAMGLLAVVWLVTLAVSMISRAPQPKSGIRRSDLAAIAASFFFAMSVVFTMQAPAVESAATEDEGSPVVAAASRGTCASIQLGMKAGEVERLLGEPDEMRSEEDVRGPQAQAWVYKASRCSVHMLAGRVDFID